MLLIDLMQRLLMLSIRGKTKYFVSHSFCSSWPNTQDKICHMVANEHPETIEVRWRLINTDVIDYEEAAEDGYIDNYGAD